MKDIVLGQYIYADSIIHRLDPRTKLLLTIALLISIFWIQDLVGYGILLIFLIIVIALSKVPAKLVLRSLKPMRWILIFTLIINLFFIKTGTVLVKFGFISITTGGVWQSIFISLRLMFLVSITSILTLTTTPMALTDGLERLLSPLKKIHFPVHELAMMMTIALRFVPTLMDESQKIMKAQMARGADFESGHLFQRAKAMIPVLVPLFVSAFRRADELAMAMESRCYHGDDGRTRMNVLHFHKIDLYVSLVSLLFVIIIFVWSKTYAPYLFAS